MRIVNPIAIKGEDIACNYLRSNQYKILERNFRIKNGEVDIIAIDNSDIEKVLAFIEVKTRTSNLFGVPFESITSWKLQSLIRVAQYYKLVNPHLPQSLRIDAISVELFNNNKPTIQLLKNISQM